MGLGGFGFPFFSNEAQAMSFYVWVRAGGGHWLVERVGGRALHVDFILALVCCELHRCGGVVVG